MNGIRRDSGTEGAWRMITHDHPEPCRDLDPFSELKGFQSAQERGRKDTLECRKGDNAVDGCLLLRSAVSQLISQSPGRYDWGTRFQLRYVPAFNFNLSSLYFCLGRKESTHRMAGHNRTLSSFE